MFSIRFGGEQLKSAIKGYAESVGGLGLNPITYLAAATMGFVGCSIMALVCALCAIALPTITLWIFVCGLCRKLASRFTGR